MNAFEDLADRVRARFGGNDVTLEVGEPVLASGLWTLSVAFGDGYLVEIGWDRHRGFGLSAGHDHYMGEGFDEIFGSPEALFTRVEHLIVSRTSTDAQSAVALGELRKLEGILQQDLAKRVGITKGGLAQIEKGQSIANMKLVTIGKLVEGLGGRLVVLAEFPGGRTRPIRIEQEF